MVKRITANLPEDKPFILLEGKSIDFITVLGMNPKYLYICPRCGKPVTHTTKLVYVAVEDTVMCTACANRWLEYARWYSDEVKKEKDNFDAMVQKLKDSKLWEE